MTALVTILMPLWIMLIPGIAFARGKKPPFTILAHIILISIVLNIASAWIATLMHLPLWIPLIIWTCITIPLALWRMYTQLSPAQVMRITTMALCLVTLYAALSILFFTYHDGLPSGDSQKAIFWAEKIIADTRLPNYQLSIPNLNRDPHDFATPGLHHFIATVMSVAGKLALTSVGLLAITLCLAVAVITAAIIEQIINKKNYIVPSIAALTLLANPGFLRYLREPGYHIQNILGEVLLFGFLLLCIDFLRKRHSSDLVIASSIIMILLFSHQFSAFLLAAISAPLLVLVMLKKGRRSLNKAYPHIKTILTITSVILLATASASLMVDLPQKITDIVNSDPHLASHLPTLNAYARIIGAYWLSFGVAGLLLLLLQKPNAPESLVLVTSTLVIFALSQGPRFAIDIPPARAMLYLAVPLSIGCAYLIQALFKISSSYHSRYARLPALIGTILLLLLPPASSMLQAFGSLTHEIPGNSTLTPDILYLTEKIKSTAATADEKILTDDFNHRASSWLLLSGQPSRVRIVDIKRQMAESIQSPVRKHIYLHQLDFEKIFNLGNTSVAARLMDKHAIRFIATAPGTSQENFMHNTSLRPLAVTTSAVLFERSTAAPQATVHDDWLIDPSTIANDIGDNEDTFEHLPVSLRATRLSPPRVARNNTTYRSSNAPWIALRFNQGGFTEQLWQQPTSFQLLLKASGIDTQTMLQTTDTKQYPIPKDGIVTLNASSLTPDEKGFITIYLHNPNQKTIAFDLIALGLTPTIQ